MNLFGTSIFNASSVRITRKRLAVDANRSIDVVYITTTVVIGTETVTVQHEVVGDDVTISVEQNEPITDTRPDPRKMSPEQCEKIAKTSAPSCYETLEIYQGSKKTGERKSPLWFLSENEGRFYYVSETIVDGTAFYGVTWYSERQ